MNQTFCGTLSKWGRLWKRDFLKLDGKSKMSPMKCIARKIEYLYGEPKNGSSHCVVLSSLVLN